MKYSVFSLLREAFRGNRLDAGLAQGRAEGRIRRRHRRRRRARACDRVLPRDRARHHQCGGAGEGLYRLRQCGPQHHHHPLELPAARQRAFYEWSMKLWEGLEQNFNYNAMVSQRGVLNLYHSDAQRDAFARRGNAMRLHGVDAELLDRDGVRAMVPFLDYDNARFPIQGGLLQRRGGTARHDAVVWGYARGADMRGVDIIENCEVTGFDIADGRVTGDRHDARHDQGEEGRPRGRRQHLARRGAGGAAAADREPRAAGLRVGRHQAGDRLRRHVRRRALLHQPVGQGRAGVRRRHRRLQLLCVARQPADRRGRDGSRHGDLARRSAASACCASGAG